jgi:tetratricopeptide (TPR) repeat protein
VTSKALWLVLAVLAAAAPVRAQDGAEIPPAPTGPQAPGPGDPDPRVAEADALLGDRAGYDRAVELYRAVLADRPDDVPVRQRLARVLAWASRYDESVAEYDRLLASPAPPDDARVERAEVLSWAGRLGEAEAEFQALLAHDPADARAARGLARSYRWSGRRADADRAYERALSLEEDAELRGEWTALRAGYRPSFAGEIGWFEDDEGLRRITQSAEAGGWLDLDTRLSARATRLDVKQPGGAAFGLPESDLGHELMAGVERHFGERTVGELALGGRTWEHAGSLPVARGRVTFTPTAGASYTAALSYSDAFAHTDSLLAVEDDVRDASAALSTWRDLGRSRELYGALGASFFSDGNQRRSAEVSLAYRPFAGRGLLLGAGLGYLGYADPSDLYYAPDLDATGKLFGRWRQGLLDQLTLDLDASGGWGLVREDGLRSDGPSWEALGSLTWARGRVHVALRVGYARSQRAIVYSAEHATLVVGLDL